MWWRRKKPEDLLPPYEAGAVTFPLDFPVLAVDSTGDFRVCLEVEQAVVRPPKRFYDVDGQCWTVTSSEPVARWGKLFGQHLLACDVQLGPPVQADLETVKMTLCRAIRNDPDDLYCQVVPHEELMQRLQDAGTWRELLHVAQEYR